MSVRVGIDVHRKRSQVAVIDQEGRVLANRNNRMHAVLADHGQGRPAGWWSGPGRAGLASLDLPAVSGEVIDDDLAMIMLSSSRSAGWTRCSRWWR